ncbi:MAG: SgcJ/EcaC family oxidoreductase [Alphaproteobacteria bacterium]|nr:SgcJ/EcaC family oxidoreductase [Alphaproteobacteria bacterium]
MRLILAAATAAMLAPAALADHHEAADDPRVAVVMDMVDAWNTQDWDRVTNLFAEDGSLHSMMVEPIIGREAIGNRIGHIAEGISEITLNIHHIGVVDDVVFIERTDEFVFNGHAGSVPVVGVIEVNDDGLITEWREYYDRAELLEAMGLSSDFDSEAR